MAKLIKRKPKRVLFKWRLLEIHEIPKAGDQYYANIWGTWVTILRDWNEPMNHYFKQQDQLKVRRRITDGEANKTNP